MSAQMRTLLLALLIYGAIVMAGLLLIGTAGTWGVFLARLLNGLGPR